MQPTLSQAELRQKLTHLGWELSKIDHKNGLYVAKGQGPTENKAERVGKTPESALAALVMFAQRHNSIRSQAAAPAVGTGMTKCPRCLREWPEGDAGAPGEAFCPGCGGDKYVLVTTDGQKGRQPKVAAWKHDWRDKLHEIADAYDKLPVYDERAYPAWSKLADESRKQAAAIRQQIDVEETDKPNPYKNAHEMHEDVHKNHHYKLSRHDLDHPVWSRADNLNFRLVHEAMAHAQSRGGFDWGGENDAAIYHLPQLSPLARQAAFTEIVGRAAHEAVAHHPGPRKIGFLSDHLEPVNREEGEHLFIPHGAIPDAANQWEALKAAQPVQAAAKVRALADIPVTGGELLDAYNPTLDWYAHYVGRTAADDEGKIRASWKILQRDDIKDNLELDKAVTNLFNKLESIRESHAGDPNFTSPLSNPQLMTWFVGQVKKGNVNAHSVLGDADLGHGLTYAQDLQKLHEELVHARKNNADALPNVQQMTWPQATSWAGQYNDQRTKDERRWEQKIEVYRFNKGEDKGWTIDQIHTQNDFQTEAGNFYGDPDGMGHCVASHSDYRARYNGGLDNADERGQSVQFSLRDKRGIPHATIELLKVADDPENPSGRGKVYTQHYDPAAKGDSYWPEGALPKAYHWEILQASGRSDQPPSDRYRAMIGEWFKHMGVWSESPDKTEGGPTDQNPNTMIGSDDNDDGYGDDESQSFTEYHEDAYSSDDIETVSNLEEWAQSYDEYPHMYSSDNYIDDYDSGYGGGEIHSGLWAYDPKVFSIKHREEYGLTDNYQGTGSDNPDIYDYSGGGGHKTIHLYPADFPTLDVDEFIESLLQQLKVKRGMTQVIAEVTKNLEAYVSAAEEWGGYRIRDPKKILANVHDTIEDVIGDDEDSENFYIDPHVSYGLKTIYNNLAKNFGVNPIPLTDDEEKSVPNPNQLELGDELGGDWTQEHGERDRVRRGTLIQQAMKLGQQLLDDYEPGGPGYDYGYSRLPADRWKVATSKLKEELLNLYGGVMPEAQINEAVHTVMAELRAFAKQDHPGDAAVSARADELGEQEFATKKPTYHSWGNGFDYADEHQNVGTQLLREFPALTTDEANRHTHSALQALADANRDNPEWNPASQPPTPPDFSALGHVSSEMGEFMFDILGITKTAAMSIEDKAQKTIERINARPDLQKPEWARVARVWRSYVDEMKYYNRYDGFELRFVEWLVKQMKLTQGDMSYLPSGRRYAPGAELPSTINGSQVAMTVIKLLDTLKKAAEYKQTPDLFKMGWNDVLQWMLEFEEQFKPDKEWHDSVADYNFPNGWTIDEVGPRDCADEGDIMGHCVGGGSYASAIRNELTKIYSLRDKKGYPHATIEVRYPNRQEDYYSQGYTLRDENGDDPEVIAQIQGKENKPPIAKYREMIREWVQSKGWTHSIKFDTNRVRNVNQSWEESGRELPPEVINDLPSLTQYYNWLAAHTNGVNAPQPGANPHEAQTFTEKITTGDSKDDSYQGAYGIKMPWEYGLDLDRQEERTTTLGAAPMPEMDMKSILADIMRTYEGQVIPQTTAHMLGVAMHGIESARGRHDVYSPLAEFRTDLEYYMREAQTMPDRGEAEVQQLEQFENNVYAAMGQSPQPIQTALPDQEKLFRGPGEIHYPRNIPAPTDEAGNIPWQHTQRGYELFDQWRAERDALEQQAYDPNLPIGGFEQRQRMMQLQQHPELQEYTERGMRNNPNPFAFQASLWLPAMADDPERDPSYRFVYYMGNLEIEKWNASLRYPKLADKLLSSFGRSIDDDGWAPEDTKEWAMGDVYEMPDKSIFLDMKQLSEPEVQKDAIHAVHEWLDDVNEVHEEVKKEARKHHLTLGMARYSFRRFANDEDKVRGVRRRILARPAVEEWLNAHAEDGRGETLQNIINDWPSYAHWLLDWYVNRVLAGDQAVNTQSNYYMTYYATMVANWARVINEARKRQYKGGKNPYHDPNVEGMKDEPPTLEPIPDILRYNDVFQAQTAMNYFERSFETWDAFKKDWQDSEFETKLDDDFSLWKIGPQDCKKEGILMQNCIKGYSEDIRNGTSVNYSIRNKKGLPVVDIEINPDDDGVMQLKGKQNDYPSGRYAELVKKALQYLRASHWSSDGEGYEGADGYDDYDEDNYRNAAEHHGLDSWAHRQISDVETMIQWYKYAERYPELYTDDEDYITDHTYPSQDEWGLYTHSGEDNERTVSIMGEDLPEVEWANLVDDYMSEIQQWGSPESEEWYSDLVDAISSYIQHEKAPYRVWDDFEAECEDKMTNVEDDHGITPDVEFDDGALAGPDQMPSPETSQPGTQLQMPFHVHQDIMKLLQDVGHKTRNVIRPGEDKYRRHNPWAQTPQERPTRGDTPQTPLFSPDNPKVRTYPHHEFQAPTRDWRQNDWYHEPEEGEEENARELYERHKLPGDFGRLNRNGLDMPVVGMIEHPDDDEGGRTGMHYGWTDQGNLVMRAPRTENGEVQPGEMTPWVGASRGIVNSPYYGVMQRIMREQGIEPNVRNNYY